MVRYQISKVSEVVNKVSEVHLFALRDGQLSIIN